MDVSYIDVTDDVRYLRFTTKPGMANQDPKGVAANRFMKAFMKTANVTRSNIKNSAKVVKLNGGAACSPAEVSGGLCVQSPHEVEDEGNEDGEGEEAEDMPRDNENGGGGDSGGGEGGDCVFTPMGSICVIHGNRDAPPPMADPETQPLPAGPTPWFPQSWCDFANIFCTNGQEPRDNDRGPNSSLSGKTLEELINICYEIKFTEDDVCYANYLMHRDAGILGACKENAWAKLRSCEDTANRVTDNGAHVAP
jgi:hypothetical protein